MASSVIRRSIRCLTGRISLTPDTIIWRIAGPEFLQIAACGDTDYIVVARHRCEVACHHKGVFWILAPAHKRKNALLIVSAINPLKAAAFAIEFEESLLSLI